MNVLALSYKNLGRHVSHTIRGVFAVLIANMVIMILFGFFGGLAQDLRYNLTHYIAGDIRIRNAAYNEFSLFNPSHLTLKDTDSIALAVETLPEVAQVSVRLKIPLNILYKDRFEPLQVQGVKIDKEHQYQRWDTMPITGTLPDTAKREILIGHTIAERFNLTVGDTMTVFGSTKFRTSNAMTFTVSGIITYPVGDMNNQSYIPLRVAQYFFKSPNESTEINIQTVGTKESYIAGVMENLVALFGTSDMSIQSWDETSSFGTMLKAQRFIYLILAFFFFLLGSLVIYNTAYASIIEREHEIGILMSMGFTSAMVYRMMWFEYAITVTIGSLLGIGVGNVVVAIMGATGIDMIFKSFDSGVPFSTILFPEIQVFWLVVIFVYGILITNLVILFPLHQVKKIQIMQALGQGE